MEISFHSQISAHYIECNHRHRSSLKRLGVARRSLSQILVKSRESVFYRTLTDESN